MSMIDVNVLNFDLDSEALLHSQQKNIYKGTGTIEASQIVELKTSTKVQSHTFPILEKQIEIV